MKSSDLITYETAAAMLKKAGLPATTRTLHRYATETFPGICPAVKKINGVKAYHYRAVRRKHVKALIAHLVECGKARPKSPNTVRNQSRQ